MLQETSVTPWASLRSLRVIFIAIAVLTFCLICLGPLVGTDLKELLCFGGHPCVGIRGTEIYTQLITTWLPRLVIGSLAFFLVLAAVGILHHRVLRKLFKAPGLAIILLFLINFVMTPRFGGQFLGARWLSFYLLPTLFFYAFILYMAFKTHHLIQAENSKTIEPRGLPRFVNVLFYGFTILILSQLSLGAVLSSGTMGTRCLDFLTCNGTWFDYTRQKSAVGIELEAIHRQIAYVIFIGIALMNFLLRRHKLPAIARLALHLAPWLVILQVLLGFVSNLYQIPEQLLAIHVINGLIIFSSAIMGSYDVYFSSSLRQAYLKSELTHVNRMALGAMKQIPKHLRTET